MAFIAYALQLSGRTNIHFRFSLFAGETFETLRVPLNRQLVQAILLKYASEEDPDMLVPVSKATAQVLDSLGAVLHLYC